MRATAFAGFALPDLRQWKQAATSKKKSTHRHAVIFCSAALALFYTSALSPASLLTFLLLTVYLLDKLPKISL